MPYRLRSSPLPEVWRGLYPGEDQMTDAEIIEFQERPFTCPYGKETVIELPPQMETIMIGRETCENCRGEFLIENDVPRKLPQ
jgi:hypothetical protein